MNERQTVVKEQLYLPGIVVVVSGGGISVDVGGLFTRHFSCTVTVMTIAFHQFLLHVHAHSAAYYHFKHAYKKSQTNLGKAASPTRYMAQAHLSIKFAPSSWGIRTPF